MKKMTSLLLTDHEISLIYTSISNHKRSLDNKITRLTNEDDFWFGDYDKLELAALNSIQKKIVEL